MNVRIEQDEGYESPREWCNLGRMVCFHGRYNLGDKDHCYIEGHYESWDELEKELCDDGAVVCLPLHLYDHSGISMKIGGFSCAWDSGQVGFIVAMRDDVLKEYSRVRVTDKLKERITKVLESEVNAYNQYLTGDVWGYVIEDDNGEHLDSCWGFYGHDYCEEEAESALKYQEEEHKAA